VLVYVSKKNVEKFYELRAKGRVPNVELRDFVNELLEKELGRREREVE